MPENEFENVLTNRGRHENDVMGNELSDLHVKVIDSWGEVRAGSLVVEFVRDETGGWEIGAGD